ncbi:DUF1992 domain-containing protein [Glutamicibacter sp. MNS18]|uniref:DnaJ family domain-containing protein n=1 Tax=Glutamicibacter sp. MNS18 TaxID=2989817 RepID=UPI0022360D00|nr:DUF1992 domain-containing protein [Glutamicibacter sp. MNS18]MCW4463930.1 DUF1992 domain-containing protein [Glutamicibacter sp. MNS18]
MGSESEYPQRDASLNAARYRAKRADQTPLPVDEYAQRTGRHHPVEEPRTPLQIHAADEAWEVANSVLDEAFARGDFDNLALAGQKIDHLIGGNDPDWWIKGLMQREKISGLGPPALTLRVEDRQLEQTLDQLAGEAQVREYLLDFNRRIIEARRQLQGGPPVVTDVRDLDVEVAHWQARRRGRAAEAEPQPLPQARRRWWRRRGDS